MDTLDQFAHTISLEIQKAVGILADAGAGEGQIKIVKSELERIARLSFAAGQSQSLSSLITTNDLQTKFGITKRRANAVAKNRHEKYGIGFHFSGNNQWYFNESDLPLLQPDMNRPRGNKRGLCRRHQEKANDRH